MNRNDLPLFLRVKDVATLMGIGKNQAYDLTHLSDFPTVKLGKRIVVPRDKLFAWVERQVNTTSGQA